MEKGKGKKADHVSARRKLFRDIIRAVGPVIKKYGKENVWLAMNYWNNVEREKNALRSQISDAQKELEQLDAIK